MDNIEKNLTPKNSIPITHFKTKGGSMIMVTEEGKYDKEMEEFWKDKYFEMQDNYHDANEEIERLNNIINKALGIANERFNYYFNHKRNNEEHLEDWENIFNALVRSDKEIDNQDKEIERLNKELKLKTYFIEELLTIISVARDYELHDKCYTRSKIYQDKLKELKGDNNEKH